MTSRTRGTSRTKSVTSDFKEKNKIKRKTLMEDASVSPFGGIFRKIGLKVDK